MRRIEKRDYEHDGTGWKLLVTTKYLYDGWDIVAAYVTTGNTTTAHAYIYGADLSGTLSGAGGIGGLVAELRFTNYDLRFGSEGTTTTRRREGEDEVRMQSRRSKKSEVLHKGAPASAATVGAIGDRGPAAASAVECGSEAAALSEGAQLPYSADAPSASTVHFYIANHRGDTVLVLGESGAAESHLQYDAFGNVTARSGSFTPSYTFSTKEHVPGANLYAYAYRVYDPHAGRWTQRDPIDYQDSINLYQFCGNNGVNVLDVDGQWNLWNPATWGVPNALGWSVSQSLNPFDMDTAGWNAFTWREVEKGAAAALDGIIPFIDPMEIAYADADGTIGSVYQWSRHIAAFSRDIYLIARIPNLEQYLKNARLHEKGCSTAPNAAYDKFLRGMNPVEKGRWLLQNEHIVKQYMTLGWRLAAYARTWNTGLTPGGRLFVITVLFEPSDALSRVE